MKSLKLYAAGPLAMVATTCLFYGMQILVGGDGHVTIESEKPRFIPVIQNIIDDPRERIVRDIPKPPEVEVQPPGLEEPAIDTPKPGKISTGIPRAEPDTKPDLIGMAAQIDGDHLPVVRVRPQYPRRAQQQGIEGYAVVELTVGAGGAVVPGSIMVVDAEPVGVFDKAAIKAAAKFKYKPRVVSGQAQSVAGVRYRFSFNMSQ